MNNQDHISESLETIFWVKYLNSLMRIWDPKWKEFGSGMKKSGSATLIILFLLFTGIVGQPDQEETVTVAAAATCGQSAFWPAADQAAPTRRIAAGLRAFHTAQCQITTC
jgi:hypothetical protein